MGFRLRVLAIALALALILPHLSTADARSDCPIAEPSSPPFIPPASWQPSRGDGVFDFGTPELWVHVNTHWMLNLTGNKLPYFSRICEEHPQNDPPMAVVARRLDAPAPLVWPKW